MKIQLDTNKSLTVTQPSTDGLCRLAANYEGSESFFYLDRAETLALATALKESAPKK